MAVNKRIIKISKEEYDRLTKDFGYILDLYMSDNVYYVIGTVNDLRAAGITIESPY